MYSTPNQVTTLCLVICGEVQIDAFFKNTFLQSSLTQEIIKFSQGKE